MKRRDLLKTAGATAAAGAAASTFPAPAISQGLVEWKLPTSFPANAPGVGTNVTSFAERLGKMSGGRITAKVFSAGELVPPFAVEDAVQQGTAEAGHSTPYFAAGKNTAIHFFSTVPFGLDADELTAWLLHGGGQQLWDDLYAERNLKPFYSGNSGVQSAGWFLKEIKSVADLSGLNMRIAGLGGEAMRKLGVNAVQLPPGEIFPAMQSGAVDAAEWVGPWLDLAFGLHKVAKYAYLPAFHEPGPALEVVVNKDAYDELSEELKEIVTAAAHATSVETFGQFHYNNILALQQLEEAGAIVGTFSDEIVSALGEASTEVMADITAANPQAKTIYDSYMPFLRQASVYASAMTGEMYRQRSLVLGT